LFLITDAGLFARENVFGPSSAPAVLAGRPRFLLSPTPTISLKHKKQVDRGQRKKTSW